MSYQARGVGYIALKESVLEQKNLNELWKRAAESQLPSEHAHINWSTLPVLILQDIVAAIGNYATTVAREGNLVVRLFHQMDNYHEDTVEKFLEIFTPFTMDGMFEFRGEDNTLWRFDFRDGSWHEDNGEIWYHTGRTLFVEGVTKFGVVANIDGARHQLSRKEIRTLAAGGALNRDPVANLVLPKLLTKYGKCFECDNSTCRLNPDGICLAPLLTGKSPFHNGNLDDCREYVAKEDV